MRAIALANPVQILWPALLRNLQALTQRGWQHRQSIGYHFRQDARALTPTGDQNLEKAILREWRIVLIAQRKNFFAHRIANQMHLVDIFVLQTLNLEKGRSNCIDAPRHHAIDPAQHSVLFVDDARDICGTCCQHGWSGRIPAEPHDGSGIEAFKQTQRHAPPF